MIIACFITAHSMAQVKSSFIHPYNLELTSNKTTNLVFPFSIQHVDKGSRDVLAQQVNGAANVLELKAAKDSFPETNVSVITSDGSLYSFNVRYAVIPKQLNIVIKGNNSAPVAISNNEKQLRETALKISGRPRSFYGMHDTHDQMRLMLKGLYVQEDVLYFQLQILNWSNVSFDVDAIHFIIRDKQKSKRTATQETPLQPVYATGLQHSIGANTKPVIVVALPKFTLPDSKYLLVHVSEVNGGRDLQIKLNNRQLIRAKNVSDAD